MAKCRERYTAKQVLEFIHGDQYTLADDDDDSDVGNESDKSTPPTSQEEHEKSKEFIPPSPYSKILPKSRGK